MSQREMVPLVEALLQDDMFGLRANVDRIVSATGPLGDPNPPSSDFHFVRWALPGTALRPSTKGNVMVRPRAWRPKLRFATGVPLREAQCDVDIGFETFATSADDIATQVSIVATAVAQCMDGLRAYSDAHGGSVLDVQDPISFQFGAFEGPTSNGFVATVTINEMSSND